MTETNSTEVVNTESVPNGGQIEDNEIRVTSQGRMRNYVAYVRSLLIDKHRTTVVLKGMGRVINKTVSLAEILKRQVKGLYQYSEIGSVRVVESSVESEEENLRNATRFLSTITIILTTEPDDKRHFQPPVDGDVKEATMSANSVKQRNPDQAPTAKTTVENEGTPPKKRNRRNRRRNQRGKKSTTAEEGKNVSSKETQT